MWCFKPHAKVVSTLQVQNAEAVSKALCHPSGPIMAQSLNSNTEVLGFCQAWLFCTALALSAERQHASLSQR